MTQYLNTHDTCYVEDIPTLIIIFTNVVLTDHYRNTDSFTVFLGRHKSTYRRGGIGVHKLGLLRLGDFQNGLNFGAVERFKSKSLKLPPEGTPT